MVAHGRGCRWGPVGEECAGERLIPGQPGEMIAEAMLEDMIVPEGNFESEEG